MKKTLFSLFLLLSPLFALYPFNVSITEVGNISVWEDYPDSKPDLMFYSKGVLYFTDPGTPALFSYGNGTLDLLMRKVLSNPSGVYVKEDGTIYVADRGEGVVRYSPYKIIYEDTGENGIYLSGGNFYLSDQMYGRMLVISEDGHYVSRFGRNGSYTGEFQNPKDVQIFNNLVYIADSGNGRVERYAPNFTYELSYGNAKEGIVLKKPNGIFVDENYVYVADILGNQLVLYTHDGYPVYSYPVESPADAVVVNNTLYVSQAVKEGSILVANISVPKPGAYVEEISDALEPAFSEYSENSGLAQLLNLSHNRTIAAEWENAKFAFEMGNYGEAFYKIMHLSESNIAYENENLEHALYSEISRLAQNSTAKQEIIFYLNQGDYFSAYHELTSSPQIIQNISGNATNATVATVNVSQLENRLGEAIKLISQYKMNMSVSEIEDALAKAKAGNITYESVASMLDALDSKINLEIYKINGAKEKISGLRREISGWVPFADYSMAERYAKDAEALLYSEPQKAVQLAEEGLSEAQRARESAQLIYFIIGLVAVAVAALALFVLKGRPAPPEQEYRFHPRK